MHVNEQYFLAIFVQVRLKGLVLNQHLSGCPPPAPHGACPGSLPTTVLEGSNKVLLYHFSSASPFSCNMFIHTHVLLLYNSYSPPLPVVLIPALLPATPPTHLMTTTGFFLYLRVTVKKADTTCGGCWYGGCCVWSLGCLLPGNAELLSCLFLQLTWLSMVPPSCEVMMPSLWPMTDW